MREKYESLSLATLKELAKARGLKGISTLRKPALIERMLQEDEKERKDTGAISETVQKEETAKLTAVVPEKESLNFWACAGCFLLLLSIPAGGGILYIRARRKGRSPEKDAARRYSPRSDMTFRTTARSRV